MTKTELKKDATRVVSWPIPKYNKIPATMGGGIRAKKATFKKLLAIALYLFISLLP
jgi:hypothetical protein